MKPFIKVIEENGKWFGTVIVNHELAATAKADAELEAWRLLVVALGGRLCRVYEALLELPKLG